MSATLLRIRVPSAVPVRFFPGAFFPRLCYNPVNRTPARVPQRSEVTMKKTEMYFESLLFRSRWMLAPFFFGLLFAIVILLVKFTKHLFLLIATLFVASDHDVIISILTLIDAALLAILLLIIAFSGYENFVSKIGTGEHEDRPAWMGKVGFADLKIKLMGAIVAISAVELLKAFVNADKMTNTQLAWRVGIHITFVVSGVLFAVTDRLTEHKDQVH
jgi:uncharacterized protein (TIGR00645 family)